MLQLEPEAQPESFFEVVGVVKNSTYADLKEGVLPVAFLADTQSPAPGYMRTVIRTSLPTATVTFCVGCEAS